MAARRLVPGVRSSVAESNREHRLDRATILRSKVCDRSRYVIANVTRARLLDVWHVFEGFASVTHAGRAAEVIDGDRVHPRFGKPLGQLLVELMKAAHVW